MGGSKYLKTAGWMKIINITNHNLSISGYATKGNKIRENQKERNI